MSLPSTVTFAVGDKDYVAKLNQIITDFNLVYAQFLLTQTGSLFADTSATSWTIGTGSKAYTLASGSQRAFQIGQTMRVARTSAPTNYGTGVVTAYTHPTLTINITATGGSGGPFTDWSIGLDIAAGAITSLGIGSATASQFIVVNSAASAIVGLSAPDYSFSDPVFWMGMQ